VISTIGKKLVNLQERDINNPKETCQFTGTPTSISNLVNFGSETAENGWRVFAHHPKFSYLETLPALPHGRYNFSRQQANFGTCYIVARAYSLQQQNAERAHVGLCHASSLILNCNSLLPNCGLLLFKVNIIIN